MSTFASPKLWSSRILLTLLLTYTHRGVVTRAYDGPPLINHYFGPGFSINTLNFNFDLQCRNTGRNTARVDLTYNLASVCLFRSRLKSIQETVPTLTEQSSALLQLTNHGEQLHGFEPERRSVLNIFHFNDQLIDGSLSSAASLYYSATANVAHVGTIPTPGTLEEEDDFSFLRELQLATITEEWQREFLFPNGQSAVRDSKLEKKWSLTWIAQ